MSPPLSYPRRGEREEIYCVSGVCDDICNILRSLAYSQTYVCDDICTKYVQTFQPIDIGCVFGNLCTCRRKVRLLRCFKCLCELIIRHSNLRLLGKYFHNHALLP